MKHHELKDLQAAKIIKEFDETYKVLKDYILEHHLEDAADSVYYFSEKWTKELEDGYKFSKKQTILDIQFSHRTRYWIVQDLYALIASREYREHETARNLVKSLIDLLGRFKEYLPPAGS